MSEAEREFYAVGKHGERLTVDECFWSVIDEAQAEWDRQAALTDEKVAALRQKMGDVGYHAYMHQRLIHKLGNILGVARRMPRPPKSNPPAGGEGKPEPVTLVDCPIGLFMWGDELCLKTEYGNNEGRIDAYIVSSGEIICGGESGTEARTMEPAWAATVRDQCAKAGIAFFMKQIDPIPLAYVPIQGSLQNGYATSRDQVTGWLTLRVRRWAVSGGAVSGAPFGAMPATPTTGSGSSRTRFGKASALLSAGASAVGSAAFGREPL